jgi:hypothetical protein
MEQSQFVDVPEALIVFCEGKVHGFVRALWTDYRRRGI